MATITPENPLVNRGLLYINGLYLSNDATTPNTLLDVSSGACRDSTNTNDIVVSSAVVINTAVNGALGLDTGTIAASTMYYVYAIGSSTNQIGNGQPFSAYPGSALISLSITQPTLPVGYDMFRRIGTIVTDGAVHILPFTQIGRRMMYQTPIATGVTGGAATAFTSVAINTTPTVPPIATMVYFNASLTPQAAGHAATLAPLSTVAGAISSQVSGDVAAVAHVAPMSSPCSATPQVFYKVANAGDALTLTVLGFDDIL